MQQGGAEYGGDPALAPKPVAASRVTMSMLATPATRNLWGTVHGGWIMRQVDETAYVAAAQDSSGQYEQDLWPATGRFRFQAGETMAWTGESGAGGPEDIRRAAEDAHGLGLLVRSLVGMDRAAAKEALARFTNGKTLTANQLEFVNLIVDHLTEYGVVKPARLYESPFTDLTPRGPEGLFSQASVDQLIGLLDDIRQRPSPRNGQSPTHTPAIILNNVSWFASARESCPTMRPSRNTRIRLERLSTSGISLEIRTMAFPAAASSSMTVRSVRGSTAAGAPRVAAPTVPSPCRTASIAASRLLVMRSRNVLRSALRGVVVSATGCAPLSAYLNRQPRRRLQAPLMGWQRQDRS